VSPYLSPVMADRLTTLFRVFGPVIYARCRRLLGDAAAAEDATQETFIRVFRHLDRAPDTEAALGWIYRIATNYCLNELRDRRLRPASHETVPEMPVLDGGEKWHVDRDLVALVIKRSPEELRVAAWLHYVDGFDQEEVARTLGISRRTVVNRLQTFIRNAQKFALRTAA